MIHFSPRERGAVIGFIGEIECEDVNEWAIAFFDHLADGDTVEEAIYHADNDKISGFEYGNFTNQPLTN